MADFIYVREDKPDHVHIVIKVPKLLWDRWEYRHRHFGAAIHALRASVVELLAIKGLATDLSADHRDPFWKG